MHILVIKLSSLGDLLHTLPAITDASNAIPTLKIDWVSDPAFQEVPLFHPAINKVICAPLRTWRKNKWQAVKTGEISEFKKKLKARHYDYIIDAQSALKTALLSTFATGTRIGLDKHSVRELGAHWFYHKKINAPKNQHAIARTRLLFSKSLGYSLPKTLPNYKIDRNKLGALTFELPEKFIVLVHATTWKTKHWQLSHWQELIRLINEAGYDAVLPFGNERERNNADLITQKFTKAHTLPKLNLAECASVLLKASGAVCVDTGLGHLANALGTPAVHLYGPTDPQKIGAFGSHQLQFTTRLSCAPCYKKKCSHAHSHKQESVCLTQLSPKDVWEHLENILTS